VTAADIAAAFGVALALAAEGRKCFPCAGTKRPATPHGFLDATNNPGALRDLWREFPGPLVGVATGEASDIDVLDLDRKHPEAGLWWTVNRHRLPVTRAHRTRSRGLHLLFQHTAGLRCTAGAIAPGVDTRGDGGYIIWWPAAGLPVLCDAPAARWAPWLLDELNPPRPAAPSAAWIQHVDPPRYHASRYANVALRRAADRVALAPIGLRNRVLNAEAYGIGRLVAQELLDAQEVADTLAAAALAVGLLPREIERTMVSAMRARGLL
jgi:hypothetical protein